MGIAMDSNNEMTQEQEFNSWLEDRPDVIKKMAETLKPWLRYRLKPTGQHCCLRSFSEDGTVTITVDGHDSDVLNQMNKIIPINVFGVSPNDLETISV